MAWATSRQLFRQKVITLVRLKTSGDLRPFPGRLAKPLQGICKLLGDDVNEPPAATVVTLVIPALHHDLEVLAVVINVDVRRLGNRVDQLLVERPIHAAINDSPVRHRRQPLELLERRHTVTGPGTSNEGGDAIRSINVLMRLPPSLDPPGRSHHKTPECLTLTN